MTKKSASVSFIFVTILLDALGLGLIIPVLPDVIRRFSSDTEFVNRSFGWFISVYALMQFAASPVLGSLSDRFGRRPILLVSLLGAGLDYLLMAFAPSLWILFIGRVISGLTGASMTVASSYMADVSDDSNRSANFGMIGAAWGLGFIFGPMIGGLIGVYGPQAPFLAAAVLNILNFFFGLFVLPESLPAASRRMMDLRRLNPFGSLMKVLKPGPIAALVWTYFLLFLAGQSHPSIWTLYTQTKFGWSAFDVGLSLSAVGVTIALAQGGGTRLIIPRIGEIRALRWGLWVAGFSYLAYGFASQGWMMYAIMLPSAIAGVAPPALQSLIARRVPPQEQGELQGSLMSMGSLTGILAPLLYTELFAHFTSPDAAVQFPGISYVIAGTVCFAARFLVAWTLPRGTEAAPSGGPT